MARFKSSDDLLEAMRAETPQFFKMRMPGNLTKAQQKAFVAKSAYKWNCGCSGMPGRLEDYYLQACDDHENIVGNFEKEEDDYSDVL